MLYNGCTVAAGQDTAMGHKNVPLDRDMLQKDLN